MFRNLLNLFVAITAVTLVASAVADDKKDTKTYEGKMVCVKCKLKEADACANAVVVKDGDKSVTYYLKDKGEKETYHTCSGEKACKVTGKVVEKDGKKWIEEAKVEMTK